MMINSFFFNFHAMPPLIIAFVLMILGLFMLSLARKKQVGVWCCFLSFFASVWLVSLGFLFCFTGMQDTTFWGRVMVSSVMLFSATMYPFADIFLNEKHQNVRTSFFLYGFAIGLIGGFWSFDIFDGFQIASYGVFPEANMFIVIAFSFMVLCFALSALNLVKQHCQFKDPFKKKISLYLFLVVFISQFALVDLLSMLQASIYPFGGIILLSVLIVITSFVIIDVRHDAFVKRQDNKHLLQELRTTQLMVMESGKISAFASISAGLLHQMSQPITAIHGFAKFLKEEMDSKDKFYRPITLIAEQSSHIKGMLGNLMELVHHKTVKKEAVDVNDVLNKTLNLLEDELRIRHIIWEVYLCKDNPCVYADKIYLQQAFLNILTNALQALDALDGKVEKQLNITTIFSEDKKQIEIAFEDNGPGILPLNQMRIFDPFFTTKEKSAGMGLSLTKDIVEEVGGIVILESVIEKQTRFVIELPTQEKS
jgi:signal transduction histidine kinase